MMYIWSILITHQLCNFLSSFPNTDVNIRIVFGFCHFVYFGNSAIKLFYSCSLFTTQFIQDVDVHFTTQSIQDVDVHFTTQSIQDVDVHFTTQFIQDVDVHCACG